MENAKKVSLKTIIDILIYVVGIPLIIALGVILFKDRKYNIISMAVAVVCCIPFFIGFEKGKRSARELTVIAVMSAISVLGRIIFTPLPGFKPVTAVVIITGIAFGPQAGFITGSMSAIVSNIFFGQGPWTPFQMFIWGFIGLLSGLLFYNKKVPNFLLLIFIGIFGGVLYSLMMDIWSTLAMDGAFLWSRYWTIFLSSLPVMAIYAASNVVFLLLLTKPLLEKLNRVKIKYGIFIKNGTNNSISENITADEKSNEGDK